MGRFLSRRAKLLIGTVVGVPSAAVVGTGAYISYRVYTKPPEHTFVPLVDKDGRLLIKDCVIDPPSKWQMVLRIVELFWTFFPVVVQYYVWGRYERHYNWWLHKLLAAVERAGPAFVKAGQWSCTRSDLFDPELRAVFTKLYSEVSIHDFETTKAIIEKEMGKPADEVFSALDEMPVGSGSIGQVHKGVLREGGREVAVKVMHPRVVELIAKDFFVINTLAKWVDKNFKSMEHLEVAVQALAWTNHLAAQLDFRIEAEHLDLFQKNFHGTGYCQIPEAITSTQRVLIESFAAGEPATPEYLGSLDKNVRDVLAGRGLDTYCKMLLHDNFVHGDLHPGNILIDARDPHDPVVTLIDVGLAIKISKRDGAMFNNLIGSFVNWDRDLCYDTVLSMGSHQKYCDKPKLKREMDELFERFRPISGDEDSVVENILQSLFEASRKAKLTMDPTNVALTFSVLVLEGFITALNPEYNMVKNAAPWLVGEGHVSPFVLRNILRSGVEQMGIHLRKHRNRLLGANASSEPFVPRRRPRFDVESGQRVCHEAVGRMRTPVLA